MMNDLLKHDLLDVKADMKELFSQNFNFKERSESQPDWIKDEEHKKKKQK